MKQEATEEKVTMENAKQLSASSLCLPACCISESVQQLMDLAIDTLCEAVGSSPYWYVPVPRTLNYVVSDLVNSDHGPNFQFMLMSCCSLQCVASFCHCEEHLPALP